jgi:1-acyl-sn-glycerol-3-phosphate acyltransferase
MEIKCFYYDGEKLNPVKGFFFPKNTPALIASNHISYLDPVVIGLAINRPIYFIANEKFFVGIRKYYLQILGIIRNDKACIKKSVRLLKKNEIVVIFPEGTRSVTGELREKFYTGVARIATLADVKVYPVCLKGTYEVCPKSLEGKGEKIPDLKTKPPVLLSYAEPLYFENIDKSDKKVFQEITNVIMGKVKEMKVLLDKLYLEEREKWLSQKSV